MGSCVSSAVRASLNLASWNCQLELSVGSWRSAGGARGFAYCTTSVCASLMRHGEMPWRAYCESETIIRICNIAP